MGIIIQQIHLNTGSGKCGPMKRQRPEKTFNLRFENRVIENCGKKMQINILLTVGFLLVCEENRFDFEICHDACKFLKN